VRVLTEGVHSGSASGIVPTSWRLLNRLLARLEDPDTGEVLVPELWAEIPDEVRAEAGRAAELSGDPAASMPAVPGLVAGGTSGADRLVRRAWAPTLTVTGVDGLPPPERAGNVLRPYTTVKLSIRLPPTVDARGAQEAVASVLADRAPEGADVSVTFGSPANGWAAPTLPAWAQGSLDAASSECFGHRSATQGEGGTIPFLAMLGERYPGTPIVATGVLGPGSNAHGPNEFLDLPMAEAVTVATARLISAAAGEGSP
jgi:acetylornithine deacetylase/succinyl-diaminopimelate desuccinylase-like protein